MPKAAVLPVPVAACPMMFFSPLSKRGIIFSWIRDGVTNHFLINAVNVVSQIHNCAKVVMLLKLLKW